MDEREVAGMSKQIYRGRMVKGKTLIIPRMFLFGGCIFVNWLRWGCMIPLTDFEMFILIKLGFDPIKD